MLLCQVENGKKVFYIPVSCPGYATIIAFFSFSRFYKMHLSEKTLIQIIEITSLH